MAARTSAAENKNLKTAEKTSKVSSKKTSDGKYKLIIVESPAKAKTIEGFLGKGYRVAASNGHLIDLPKSNIGVNI